MTDFEIMPRLVYIAEEQRIQIPKFMVGYLGMPAMILNEIARGGIYSIENNQEKLLEAYEKGSRIKKIQDNEFKKLVAEQVFRELSRQFDSERIDLETLSRDFRRTETWQSNDFSHLEKTQFTLSEIGEMEPIEVFPNPFPPFNALLDGWYRGLWCVAGKTGTGKTRITLSIAMYALDSGLVDEVHYYESEMSEDEFVTELQESDFENHFNIDADRFKFFIGDFDTTDILAEYRENPNENRLVIFDSPDHMVGGDPVSAIPEYKKMILDMMKMRNHNHTIIFTSQLKTGVRDKPTEADVTGTNNKAHYASLMFGMWRNGEVPNSDSQPVHFNVMKKRFGKMKTDDNDVRCWFNYKTLVTECEDEEF